MNLLSKKHLIDINLEADNITHVIRKKEFFYWLCGLRIKLPCISEFP